MSDALPVVGARLPGADQAYGIEEKLVGYCLNVDHPSGGPKAQGFQRILGIGADDAGYLADALRAGLRDAQISAIRDNGPYGVLCEVRVMVSGLNAQRNRMVPVTTA